MLYRPVDFISVALASLRRTLELLRPFDRVFLYTYNSSEKPSRQRFMERSPPLNATTCPLVDFVVLPPGHGRSVTDFSGWDANEAQLRCPDGVNGDIGGCSARRGLKPKFY